MKRINIKIFIATALLSLFLGACSKILDEQPRASFTADFSKTKEGLTGEVNYMYDHLRFMYGNGYVLNNWETGTDEATWGQSGSSGSSFQAHDFSVPGALPTQTLNDAGEIWTRCFPAINTANGVIENGLAAGLSPAVIAEARLFRAFDYFLLVQTFGGVPLDLGNGRLKFNKVASRTSKRDSVTAVYTKAIFPDLLQAINDLTTTPRAIGCVTKNVARLYLSKAYLTYGWWLENPNNIPTYPEVTGARIDPDGHTAQWYYQQAYNIATAAIAAPTPYALQATYYDVNVGTNDRNTEMMLYADHTQSSETYNGASLTYENGGNGANFAGWFLTWSYPNMQSRSEAGASVASVQRASLQPLGRPWVRMAPTIGVFTNTFADKTNDSRYDGTFTTVYRGNWNLNPGTTYSYLYNANRMKVYMDSAVLTFLPAEPVSTVAYPPIGADGKYVKINGASVDTSAIGGGKLPGIASYVIPPSAINRIVFPGLWKLGPYRTDNNGGIGNPNAGSTRPFPIAKFSELFFIAAEAAVKGATPTAISGTYANDGTALGLINIIRARAGKWKWDNGGNKAKVADNSAAMKAATPATVDINYILAERSREYYGEGYRWYDLVRTQKWGEIAATFQIGGIAYENHTPVTYSRNITSGYYLRPIPQGQFDGMLMSDADKKLYQNPQYR